MSRRKPVATSETSTILYPSALFSLERDEIYPYERFAYNVLSTAVEAFHTQNLPLTLTVDFTQAGQKGGHAQCREMFKDLVNIYQKEGFIAVNARAE